MSARKSARKPRAIDLFAGCGGVTEGLKKAGFRVIAAVENDPPAIQVYKDNHGGVKLFGDIRTLSCLTLKRTLSLQKGDLDLLAGCPPCQGFSRMTTRNGCWRIGDPRNSLIDEFGRFIEELCPSAVMLENVPGLASERKFAAFCRRLGSMDYQVVHHLVDAADYGVPQRRQRLILLASRDGPIDIPEPAAKRVTVRDAIGRLPRAGISGDEVHDLPETHNDKVRRLISSIPKDGGSRTDLPRRRQLPCHRRCDGFKDVYGRMAWDQVSPTITSGCYNPSKGRFLHPKENRCITIREAALLQSFPPDYRLRGSLGKCCLASLIGNALPPELARRHALAIRRRLSRYAAQ